MQIYIPCIYRGKFVFEIADICVEVLRTNLMKVKNEINQNILFFMTGILKIFFLTISAM